MKMGLPDTATGLLAGADRLKGFSIMRDSRIGTFGAIGIDLSFCLRAAALSSMPTHEAAMASIAAATLSSFWQDCCSFEGPARGMD